MANYYNINRSIEAYEFLTIDPDDGQLKNILNIAGGGGGVDLSNYYTKPETDTLLGGYYDTSEIDTFLVGKLSVLNPSVSGNLTLTGTITGVDAVLSSVLSCVSLNTNTIYTNQPTQNVEFGHTDALLATTIYMEYDYDYDTSGGLLMGVPLVLASRLDIPLNSQLYFQHTDSYINETLNSGNFLNYVMREATGQMDFYVGDPAVSSNLIMTLKNNIVEFNKPTNLALGGDTSNCVKYTGETEQVIDGAVVVGGGSRNGTDILTVNGGAVFSENGFKTSAGQYVEFDTGRTIRAYGDASQTPIDVEISNGNGSFRVGVGGPPVLLAYQRLSVKATEVYIQPIVRCSAGLKSNFIDTYTNVDLYVKRNDVDYIQLGGTKLTSYFPLGVASNKYDSVDNADVEFRRNAITFFYLRNNLVELNSGITLQSSSANIDTINTTGDNDMVLKRNNTNFIALSQATGKIFLQ